MPKTAKFAQVVKKSGKPEIHFRFGPLNKDAELQRAVKQKRVMTIHHEPRGQKKDFGLVGLHDDPHAQIFIFPKSLASFADKHVIAINYDLVHEEKVVMRPDQHGEGWKPKKKTRKKERDDKIVQFDPQPEPEPTPEPADEKPPRRGKPPKPPKPAKPKKHTQADLLREIRAAVRDLKSGKSVAAYERLKRLV